ncbi:hypothetical protein VTJ49DRAFT_1362 [Mycothermus thermophilus]|uniref:Uncharacterized protein n=1 Tax=Humicola insolens TaxID=85995 RepID=A0ABR3VPN0_HUMIN
MAPQLPRPSISSLQAALSACRISSPSTTTTTLRPGLPLRRTFTTTPATRTVPLPPESPRFITVPDPPQSSEPKLPPIKGHLPVPRDIFPRREGDKKIQPEYIAAATKLSKAEAAGLPPRSERQALRRALAHARRAALAEGLKGLYARKTTRVARKKARAEKKRQENLAAATAPERLDDVLTRPSVRLATSGTTFVAPDPARFERAEAARKERERREAEKAEARRDALARLYVAASNFIVDEAELEKKIDEIFVERYYQLDTSIAGRSIWDMCPPVSVSDLLSEHAGTTAKVADANRTKAAKTTLRQKEVAEELTGGKL